MRLLNATTHRLEDFSNRTVPEYAILSHTWDGDEFTYQDLFLTNGRRRKGWTKIEETCRLALKENIGYVWVDTCCIDKSSSAELSEAINSMFGWYLNAYVCFAYLSDLTHGHSIAESVGQCKWWTRGWTLQELIAPKRVEFFDATWRSIGDRKLDSYCVSQLNNIPEEILQNGGTTDLRSYSVAARMSWAAHRETTRPEDTAYCLLGVFDINMPVIYGEGCKAFRRLQHEILRQSNDLTIFACNHRNSNVSQNQEQCLFADSPYDFLGMTELKRPSLTTVEPSVTCRGVKLTGQISLELWQLRQAITAEVSKSLVLFLGYFGKPGDRQFQRLGICLFKVGPNLYHRDPRFHMVYLKPQLQDEDIALFPITDVYLLTEFDLNYNGILAHYREGSIHVPEHDLFSLDEVVPQAQWDTESRLFLGVQPNGINTYDMVFAMSSLADSLRTLFIVLCDCRYNPPSTRLFTYDRHIRIHDVVFQARHKEKSMSWIDLELHIPEVKDLRNSVLIRAQNTLTKVSVSCKYSNEEERFRICFKVTANDKSPERSSILIPRGSWVDSPSPVSP